jgi:hypothetical protein
MLTLTYGERGPPAWQDFDHGLAGREGELVLAQQEGAGGVNEGQLGPDQAGQSDVQAGAHQNVGHHGVAVQPGVRGVPEQ